jgi:hypothetical protein
MYKEETTQKATNGIWWSIICFGAMNLASLTHGLLRT